MTKRESTKLTHLNPINFKSSNSSLAIIDVPISLLALRSSLTNNDEINVDISTLTLSLNDNKKLKNLHVNLFKETNCEIHSKKSFYWIIKKIIFSYKNRLNNLFITDLGIKNKMLIILMRYDNLFILDDGLASILREEKAIKFIMFISKSIFNLNGRRNIRYLSLYKKVYELQPGYFNLKLSNKKKSNVFENKCFYVCSAPTDDGMSIKDEDILTERVKSFSESLKKELLIIPHRVEEGKLSKKYKFSKYVYKIDSIFEEFYSNSEFKNCTFITLYSGAILCVDDSHEKFYIRDYFKPKIKKTFINKILLKKNLDINIVYDYFDECNVKKLNANDMNIK